jgi:hypothetical protein
MISIFGFMNEKLGYNMNIGIDGFFRFQDFGIFGKMDNFHIYDYNVFKF